MSPTSETANGGRRLVIVESPAKAKTIKGYLGPGYIVEASVGHIRDLPSGAAEVPEKYTGETRRLGVDVEHDFQPVYVVNADKKSQVKKLKDLLRESDELFLATDEDREGEAIAWHLQEVLKPKIPVHRMVFHEITKDAIRAAVANPRELNQKLVDAQETRRILDRLYGYEVSPVLWKKVMSGLSAGRVQSVATRLVVERERERIAFRSAAYWDLTGTFGTGRTGDASDPSTVVARLNTVDGKRVAQGRDFDASGRLKSDVLHLDEQAARTLASALAEASFAVRSVESKPYRRSPYAPFRTTTLQQEASRKLGFGAKATMQVAQKLYENGFITYMRTDSTTLSDTAISAARAQVTQLYGADYLPEKPRTYAGKVKNAQEAHEAIRPSGDRFRTPAETGLTGDQFRLYELIWKRTVASQMKDATGNSVTVRLGGTASDGRDAEFSASGKTITFHGFLKAYVEGADDPNAELDDRERRLPQVAEGDPLSAEELTADGHATKPPARYTEASLVKELEEREIGRPSTYASILGTILDRGYVFKKGTALVPSFLSFAVVNLLERHFGRLVDYDFTAKMEDDLDRIARGEAQAVPWLRRFYFGEGDGDGAGSGAAAAAGNGDGDHLGGLKELVTDLGAIDAREISSFPVGDGIVLRVGRYGPYVERGEKGTEEYQHADIPSDLAPDELTVEFAEEQLAKPSGDFELGTDPETGREIVAKNGRYGPYVTEILPEGTPKTGKNAIKPRTASLFKSMTLDTVTLQDALKLMSLPRVVGADPEGVEITAQNGRYGPYLKRGTDSRSLQTEDQIFDITLDEALAIYAQPKQRGRAAAKPPLKELGEDPVSGKPVVVKDGRFGAYVTDGETNATLRASDSVEELTPERGYELLAEKRAKGPAKKTAKKAAKKAPAKKTATTGAAKKTATKKTAAKKTTTAKKTAAKTTTAKKAAAGARSGAGGDGGDGGE
ncbi:MULTISPECIES: type I DNA topoisomerase [unclassified Streptomyces]|uniref:DNA topoisomerase 1 n=1 Tax=Streptomyces evansiae TaxID=3075535 RepID=A0ABD5EAZ1_9ACTN|nr:MULTISPECIES: type I DNA topoisomerase [unclassified Streptomyces]ASY33574.1 DNA topoisomerase I [Streptomyces sp. CLI2509]EFL01637.1 DNA topoisomerase I [Streptomyces sp. SPB78]MDT0413572.1 type I DNA topoisomerase [Streptomyces sp. DSM 41979]MDT0417808.1 type I DNA topoisomerase [Streptomyces sp. DSM 41982]MDT0425121.1 type I DNA topoisomerase [Streptomyces sp. DSM 41859]